MRHLTLAAALCLGVASAAPAQDADYSADTVLATVNGTEITLGHVIVLVEGLPEQYQQIDDETLFSGVLDQLIGQAALSDTLGDDDSRVALAMDNQRAALRANRVAASLASEITDAEIQAAYDEEIGSQPPGVEYNASHILVASEEEAAALVTELEGGADFAELAKEKSTGPSGPNGGALGWFGDGQMVPEFEAAVKTLEAGGISAPVQTQFGWHVVKLNETRDITPPTLDELRPQIAQTLADEKVSAGIDEIREAATIDRPELAIPASAIRETGLLDAQ